MNPQIIYENDDIKREAVNESKDEKSRNFKIPSTSDNYDINHIYTYYQSDNDESANANDSNEDIGESLVDCDDDKSESSIEIDFNNWSKLVESKASCDTAVKNISSQNLFSLEKQINVLEAYDRKLSFTELSRLFGCSWEQICNIVQNRNSIQTAYLQTVSNRNVYEQKMQKHNLLSLKKRVKVIKMYNCYKHWRSQLPTFFDCSRQQISQILKNHKTILKKYNEARLKLDLYRRAKVINLQSRESLSSTELSKVFNCSNNQIKYILQNSNVILKNYRRAKRRCCLNGFKLNELIEIIKAVDSGLDRNEICNMFKCSKTQFDKCLQNRNAIKQLHIKNINELSLISTDINAIKTSKQHGENIVRNNLSCKTRLNNIRANGDRLSYNKCLPQKRSILRERETIMNEYDHNSQSKNDALPNSKIFKNLKISNYKEAFVALKPLEDYAKLRNNIEAENLLTHLKEYLHFVMAREPCIVETVVESSKSPKLCSYEGILLALKPVEDYVKMKNNDNATNSMSQLEEHLKMKLNKGDVINIL